MTTVEDMHQVTDAELDAIVRREVAVERCNPFYERGKIFVTGMIVGSVIACSIILLVHWMVV